MPSELRMKRINDRVKEVLSIALLTKAEDPRLADVSITDVKIDRELDYANIYVSAIGGQAVKDEVIEALNHARGFLKYELANEVDLRIMPKLRFFWDPTPEKAQRIDTLLNQIRQEEASRAAAVNRNKSREGEISETKGTRIKGGCEMNSEIDARICEQFAANQNFTVVAHIRPDGDAVGSVLGLGTALQNLGKKVQFVLPDMPGEKYSFLPNFDELQTALPDDPGYLIVVDCGDASRTGSVLQGRQPDLVIDHHKTNAQFGKINLIGEKIEATGLLIANHISHWGLMIDAKVANALLTGILADTIGFRTSNVTPDCLRTSARLMEIGADLPVLYQKVLLTRSVSELRYWGQGLYKLTLDDGLLWTSLSLEERALAGYSTGDDADLINNMSAVAEMEIAVVFVEQTADFTKVSWRSKPGFDVSVLAKEFGGGGHAAAAGADVNGCLSTVIKQVLNRTRQFLIEIRGNRIN